MKIERDELRKKLDATNKRLEYVNGLVEQRGNPISMKIEVDKPRIITALERCIKEISDTVDDAGVSSDLDKPKQDDGWIEWHGGECPVPVGTPVVVRYRCGMVRGVFGALQDDESGLDASAECWRNDDHQYDIVAYRLAK